jgi:hypothetical protein
MKNIVVRIAMVAAVAAFLLASRKAEAAYTTFTCTPSTVQLIVNSPSGAPRVAVSCTAAAPGGISWFSYRISDSVDNAKMLLSTFTSAKIAGRTINVSFESTDTSGVGWGCDAASCRIIKQALLN